MWFLIAAATIPAMISFVAGYGLGYRKATTAARTRCDRLEEENDQLSPPYATRDYPPIPSAPELFEG